MIHAFLKGLLSKISNVDPHIMIEIDESTEINENGSYEEQWRELRSEEEDFIKYLNRQRVTTPIKVFLTNDNHQEKWDLIGDLLELEK